MNLLCWENRKENSMAGAQRPKRQVVAEEAKERQRFSLPEIAQLVSGIYSFIIQAFSTSSVSGLMPGSGTSDAIDD